MDFIKYWFCLLEWIVYFNGKIKMFILFIGFYIEIDEYYLIFVEGLFVRN